MAERIAYRALVINECNAGTRILVPQYELEPSPHIVQEAIRAYVGVGAGSPRIHNEQVIISSTVLLMQLVGPDQI